MKTYTFNLGKKNNTTFTPSFSNDRSFTDALIFNNLKSTIPYIFGEDDNNIIITPKSSSFFTPKKESKTIIDITIKKSSAKKPSNDYDEFMKAINFLRNNNKDTYDFLLADGTPIKLFSDEIQIGYDLIPLNKLTRGFYDSLSSSTKKNIIDIYIDLTK